MSETQRTEPEGHPEASWATPFVALIEALKQGPYAAMLGIGLLLLVAAFIQQLGSYKIKTTEGSQLTMVMSGCALIGIALLAPAVGAARRNREREDSTPYPLPPEANNLDFMFRLFYVGMPPAFVKRVDEYDRSTQTVRSHDILYSKAFDLFQAAQELREVQQEGAEVDLVHEDHLAGDRRALANGQRWSMQFEYPPALQVPILTVKTSFEHKGHQYIAGWYVPVDRQGIAKGAPTMQLRQVNGLPRFKPMPETRPDDGVTAQIGLCLQQPADDPDPAR